VRGRWLAAVVAGFAAVCVACGGSGATHSAELLAAHPVAKAVHGPILAIVTAASVNANGQPSGISHSFAPSQPKVTALVVLGKLRGAGELTVSWSQVTSQGPQQLFTQSIAVNSFGRAYSTAVSQGVLAAGSYRVSASIDGVSRSVVWVVPGAADSTSPNVGATGATTAASASASPAAQSSPVAFAAGAGSSTPQPPVAGPSGTIPPPSAPSTGCAIQGGDEWGGTGTWQYEEKLGLGAAVLCAPAAAGVTYSGSVFATMASTLVPVGHLDFDPPDLLEGASTFDPCSLPGGSDLPGAKLTYEVVVYKPGPTKEFTGHATLDSDHASPVLSGGSVPVAGTMVHEGQTITVHITATEPTTQGPQEGIHDIQLTGPDGLIDSKDYGTHPTKCDTSRLTKTLTATYTVPKDPPPVITLTAHASDFAGNESTPLSASFPTTKTSHWTGTMDTTATVQTNSTACPTETETRTDTLDLTVDAQGAVQGTQTGPIVVNCPGLTEQTPYSGAVTGQLTTHEFSLFLSSFTGTVVVPLTSANMAYVQVSGTIDGTAWTTTVTLTRSTANS
jgi:hypothetical protein